MSNRTAVSGRELHKTLGTAVTQLETERRGYDTSLTRVEHEIARLKEEADQVYISLASTHLPELSARVVADALPTLRTLAENAFSAQELRRNQLQQLTGVLTAQRQELETKKATIDDALADAARELDAAKAICKGRLGSDRDYALLSAATEAAHARLDAVSRASEAFAQERAQKEPGFEHPLFQYLFTRGFNTPAYGARGITARLDRALALAIDYATQSQEYRRLTEILPSRYEQELGRSKESVREAERRERDRREAVRSEVGLPAREDVHAATRANQAVINEQLDSTNRSYEGATAELSTLLVNGGSFYAQAIQQYKRQLQDLDLPALERLARETPSEADDALVERLQALNGRIAELKTEAESLRAAQRTANERIREVTQAQKRINTGRYDEYRGIDLGSVLDGFVLGQLTAGTWGRSLDSSYRNTTPPPPPPVYESPSRHDSGIDLGGSFGGSDSGISMGGEF